MVGLVDCPELLKGAGKVQEVEHVALREDDALALLASLGIQIDLPRQARVPVRIHVDTILSGLRRSASPEIGTNKISGRSPYSILDMRALRC